MHFLVGLSNKVIVYLLLSLTLGEQYTWDHLSL